MITLIKDGRKMDFTEKAAKIATESLGWSEIIPLVRPKELFTKTKPPEIKLIEPAEEVFVPELNILPGTDNLTPDPIKDLGEVKNIVVKPEPKKRTRTKK